MSRCAIIPIWFVTVCAFTAGCSTHAHRLTGVRDAYFAGDLAAAKEKIDASLQKSAGDADVLKLDQATILLAEGKAREAERLLKEVRDRFDHLEQKDLAEGALALLTDDQQLAYAGEDYERVLIRVFLALANLLGDGQDAGAYALQVAAKQQQIIQTGTAMDGKNPKMVYGQVAAGAYIHAALREETHTNYDDAVRSLEQACTWEPGFRLGRQHLERLQQGGRHSTPGHGVLYVFTLVGRGPYKEERSEIPTTVAMLIADRIISAVGKHSVPPTLAPIKVPCVVLPPNDVQAVQVAVNGKASGQTETVTDVGRLAIHQAEVLAPYVLGRAVARRAVKKAVVYGAKEALPGQVSGLVSFALDVGGVVWEATEAADTRCWGLLPEKIQVLRIELPAGKHELSLQPVATSGSAQGPAKPITVQIDNGRNTYVLGSFPTARLAGPVVSSRPPQ